MDAETESKLSKYDKAIRRFQKVCQKRHLLNYMVRSYKVAFRDKTFIMNPKKIFYDIRTYALTKPTIPREDNAFMLAHGINFDTLTRYIQKKPVIDVIESILHRLYRYMNTQLSNADEPVENEPVENEPVENEQNDIDKQVKLMERIIAPQLGARDVLSAFCLAGFPEYTLEKTPMDLEKEKGSLYYDIHSLSRKLIGKWGIVLIAKPDEQDEALRRFIKCLNMYANCFALFMNQDKISKVQECIQRWYQGEKQKDLVKKDEKMSKYDRAESIKVFNKAQCKLIELITKTDPNFKKDQLAKYKILMDRIEDNIQKGFWDSLRAELRVNKYDFFLKLLKEIRDEILSLLPANKESEARKNFEANFDDKFDMDFIKQMTDHGAYSGEQFVNLAHFLIEAMKELQAPVRTPNMVAEWKQILDKIAKNEIESTEDRGVVIIKFLLEEVQMIKDSILSMQIMADFGINMFDMK